MKKFIVICVSSESGVCSVDPFDTELDAQTFLKKDSQNTYDEEKKSVSGDDLKFDSEKEYAQLTEGEYSWSWTVHPLEF